MSKIREINLLPDKYRFDIKKHILVRLLIIFAVANIAFLIFVIAVHKYEYYKINKIYKTKSSELSALKNLNSKFDKYKKENEFLKKNLVVMKEKERTAGELYNLKYSSFVDLVRLVDILDDNIKINSISYTKGEFTLTANINNVKSFYSFYKSVETNSNISEKRFYYLNMKKGEGYEFKVTFKMKGINGTN